VGEKRGASEGQRRGKIRGEMGRRKFQWISIGKGIYREDKGDNSGWC
jgi:hypothetical protein